jgi:Skp family chaperone for outer membrane proteins
MRKAILVGMLGCLLGFGSFVFAAELKIGYVNLQRVKDTDEWKRLEDLFQAEVSRSKVEVEQRKKELEVAALQYQRQQSMLSEDAQRDKERDLKTRQLEVQLWAEERQKSLEKKRDEMSQQIWSQVNDAVEKIAKKKHLTLVIDYNPNPTDVRLNFEKGFVYLAPEMDITDEVIKTFITLFQGEM